jgi:hypothetical protein
MSPVCELEMALPRGFSGVWGDGSGDERWRAAAARGAAGFGSATASAVSDQVASCSPPPNPSPIMGEGCPGKAGGDSEGRIAAVFFVLVGLVPAIHVF